MVKKDRFELSLMYWLFLQDHFQPILSVLGPSIQCWYSIEYLGITVTPGPNT
jgi:hypothetical protein